jgi:hypothetical protein
VTHPVIFHRETTVDRECEGCGNVWNGSRAIPCSPLCRYADHPEFNRDVTRYRVGWGSGRLDSSVAGVHSDLARDCDSSVACDSSGHDVTLCDCDCVTQAVD